MILSVVDDDDIVSPIFLSALPEQILSHSVHSIVSFDFETAAAAKTLSFSRFHPGSLIYHLGWYIACKLPRWHWGDSAAAADAARCKI